MLITQENESTSNTRHRLSHSYYTHTPPVNDPSLTGLEAFISTPPLERPAASFVPQLGTGWCTKASLLAASKAKPEDEIKTRKQECVWGSRGLALQSRG